MLLNMQSLPTLGMQPVNWRLMSLGGKKCLVPGWGQGNFDSCDVYFRFPLSDTKLLTDINL